MNKLLLLTTALLIPDLVNAAETSCSAAPTCESLGYKYSEFTCTSMELKYVSCPFDKSKVACISKLPGVSSSGSVNLKTACQEAGYPYSAAQCGKIGSRRKQAGIRCPYSSSYYYCESPNKNASAGWYFCEDGTVSSSSSECIANSGSVIGVVIKAPTSYSKGVVALTRYGDTYSKGSGIGFNAWCANTSEFYGSSVFSGSPRAPYYDTELALIHKQFSKIKSQNSSVNYPLWGNACWAGNSGGNSCKAISSSGTISDRNNNSDAYGICVADF